eukprot:TCALIF_09598-PA protein Name:"Protein of unknown function" AED:0.05 eAED:0.05 QI:578/1/0.5/1/0/0.5/2/0/113
MKVTEKKYLNVHQTISPLTSSTNSTHSSKSAAAAAVAAANNLANGLLVAAGDVGDDYNANKANEKILQVYRNQVAVSSAQGVNPSVAQGTINVSQASLLLQQQQHFLAQHHLA